MLRLDVRACFLASLGLAAACAGASERAEPAAPDPDPAAEAEADPAAEEVKPIPERFARGPVPHLVVAGASEAIDYYGELFGAEEIYRAPGPSGTIVHAMIRIGDSLVTLSDEQPEAASFAPGKYGGSPVGLHVYVEDAAEVHASALASGATENAPVRYQFWGDRHGSFTGPFGHTWSVATRVHDVPEEEIEELAPQVMSGETIEEPEGAAPMPPPEGWSTVTPSLLVADVAAAADFYGEAFGATMRTVMPGPEGEPFGAAIEIRDQIVMLGAAPPAPESASEAPAKADPRGLGGTPVHLTLYVEDAEAAVARALEAGGSERLPLQEMFWGDLWSEVEDPHGHLWSIATHVEDVSPEEMEARMEELGAS